MGREDGASIPSGVLGRAVRGAFGLLNSLIIANGKYAFYYSFYKLLEDTLTPVLRGCASHFLLSLPPQLNYVDGTKTVNTWCVLNTSSKQAANHYQHFFFAGGRLENKSIRYSQIHSAAHLHPIHLRRSTNDRSPPFPPLCSNC